MKTVKIVFWIVVSAVIIATLFLALSSPPRGNATGTNVNSSATSSVAWDDLSGWWDFYNTGNVQVQGARLQGYASSSIGDISLDCATTRNGNICGTSNYGVCNGNASTTHNIDGTCSNSQANGNLSGFGWNDVIGWISFCGGSGTANCPGSQPYGVTIDNSTGDFTGYAWNDLDGWIKFNCAASPSTCGTNQFKLSSSWRATSTLANLTSSIFDTQDTNGATLKSLIWEGNSPVGTCVNFQIAAATSTGGPWNYLGPSGDSSTYYSDPCSTSITGGNSSVCATKDTPICVDSRQFNNYRYYRYNVQLRSDLLQTLTPRVDDVILNFSQ